MDARGAFGARLLWACATAVLLGGWLFAQSRRGSSGTGDSTSLLPRLLAGCLLFLSGLWAVVWLTIAAVRLPYPYELEWCGGCMRDTCARILAGLPIYVPPGGGWFPYEYPPLYFWVSAALMRLMGGPSYAPMRVVSIVSTIGSCVVMWLWARSIGGRRRHVWPLVAPGIFLASYRFTGAWYDIERLDMLFLFLSLLGCYWLESAAAELPRSGGRRGNAEKEVGLPHHGSETGTARTPEDQAPLPNGQAIHCVLAALAFALAFLTKQQAALFIVAGVGALLWQRRWRLAALFILVSFVACALPVWLLDRSTHGWYWFYCFHVPMANGTQSVLLRWFLFRDMPLYAPVLMVLLLAALCHFTRTGEVDSGQGNPAPTADSPCRAVGSGQGDPAPTRHSPLPMTTPVLAAMTVAGLLGSLLSRAHWGGYENVLITGYGFAGLAACVAAGGWATRRRTASVPLYGLMLAQFLAVVYRPAAQMPTAASRAAGDRYMAAIRALERGGDVYCQDHGGFTVPAHFQFMGLHDVTNAEKRIPAGFSEALRAHRYAAIVMDAKPDEKGLTPDMLRYYQPAACLQMQDSWCVTGFLTPAPDRQVWVLKPR